MKLIHTNLCYYFLCLIVLYIPISILVFVYFPATNAVMSNATHGAGIVHKFKVGLGSSLPPFWLEEVGGLAQVVVKQCCLEGRVCRLWKHTLLLQDGENAHRLQRRQR